MNPFEKLIEYRDTDGVECRYVKPLKLGAFVWKKTGDYEYSARRMEFDKVTKEILIEADIWSDLNDSTQCRIEEAHIEKIVEVKEKMAKARENRKKKYDFSHLPEFLECKCGRQVKANYYNLQKKADEKKVPLDDLVKAYQCQTCNPTKGRRKKK